MSGKLIPEFDGRRNIRDMFARKPSLPKSESTALPPVETNSGPEESSKASKSPPKQSLQVDGRGASTTTTGTSGESALSAGNKKRSLAETSTQRSLKRSKSGAAASAPPSASGKGQQSLKGFFKMASTTQASPAAPCSANGDSNAQIVLQPAIDLDTTPCTPSPHKDEAKIGGSTSPASTTANESAAPTSTASTQASPSQSDTSRRETGVVHDPIQSKESWSKLFTKPAAPRCEGHDEPCKTMLTKKNGMNQGRSFWMCARPLGPSGDKEKNTQWRCHTFIWCSDWNPGTMA